MKQLFILLELLLLTSFVFGQVTITGTVFLIDEEDAIGANVVVYENESIGTVTEFDGTFTLDVPSLPVTLEIYYTGYTTQHIRVKKKEQNISITLGIEDYIPSYIFHIDSRLRHSASYTFISSEDFNIDNSTNIIPIMNSTPGVHIHSGALNTNRITIRGIGNRSPFTTSKIKAYLDEIPLTSGIGETSLDDINLDLLSEIQIIKGPNVSNYGSGLGGSIILKTVWTNYGDFASSKFDMGSYGLYRTSNSALINKKKSRYFC